MKNNKDNIKKLKELTNMLPPVPDNEIARIEVLKSLQILDTNPEEIYDDITRLLSDTLNVPIALFSLVDENRQWFKSNIGLSVSETSRNVSFCNHAVSIGDKEKIFIVEDATKDDRFSTNPLVLLDPSIKFYVGCPVVFDGMILGTLCAIDKKPRSLSMEEIEVLTMLTKQVIMSLEIRKKIIDLKK